LEREEKADKEPETTVVTHDGPAERPGLDVKANASRSRSRHRTVSYQGQSEQQDVDENTTVSELLQRKVETSEDIDPNLLSASFIPVRNDESGNTIPVSKDEVTEDVTLILPGTNVTLDSPMATRPKADGIAFPFKLGKSLLGHDRNASMITLKSNVTSLTSPSHEKGESDSLKMAPIGMGTSEERKDQQTTITTTTTTTENGHAEGGENDGTAKLERPQPERFVTAQEEL
jgi:hypothetical protein